MPGTSHVSIGETGLLFWCEGKAGVSLESNQQIWASSEGELGNTVLFSNCGGKLGFPLKC